MMLPVILNDVAWNVLYNIFLADSNALYTKDFAWNLKINESPFPRAQVQFPYEFRFFLLSSSLCRIWTYQSKTLTVLQSRKLAEAIFTFFYVEASRKCVLQEFVVVFFFIISYEQHIKVSYIDIYCALYDVTVLHEPW